ncbi:MAG: hypothetical protein AAFN50_00385 [Pseudomonadota bacterium]
MIVTDTFVYIHTSRSAGTFLNKLIMDHVQSARMIQYHGHLRDLPQQFTHLPVIGLVRNPWDWYVSMFYDYRRKQQYIYQVLSNRGTLGFADTVRRFLTLGDGSEENRRLLQQLCKTAPAAITRQTPPRRRLPGLRSEHFASYPPDRGYYSWLFELMYSTDRDHAIHIGHFENLRSEVVRLFEETKTPISNEISTYLEETRALNASPRPPNRTAGYTPELAELVREKDRTLIDKWGYSFD